MVYKIKQKAKLKPFRIFLFSNLLAHVPPEKKREMIRCYKFKLQQAIKDKNSIILTDSLPFELQKIVKKRSYPLSDLYKIKNLIKDKDLKLIVTTEHPSVCGVRDAAKLANEFNLTPRQIQINIENDLHFRKFVDLDPTGKMVTNMFRDALPRFRKEYIGDIDYYQFISMFDYLRSRSDR